MEQTTERIEVPADWDTIRTRSTPVDEGPWSVMIRRPEVVDGEIRVQFEVLNDGPFHGRLLFRNYSTRTRKNAAALKELYESAAVPVDGPTFDTEALTDRVIHVYVKHNEGQGGRVFANVVRHWADSDRD